MTPAAAIEILRSGGMLSAYDESFAAALARMAAEFAAPSPEVLDLARVSAALASHATLTGKSDCLDVAAADVESLFPEIAADGAEAAADKDLSSAARALARVFGDTPETRVANIDSLALALPNFIHLAGDLAAGPPFVPLVWHPPFLYLQRYWEYERELAARLSRLAAAADTAESPSPAELAGLCGYFTGEGGEEQARAAELAMRKRLAVVTGGPGTGKTTIVAVILAKMLMDKPDAAIALCAPTGKAQARMLEAIRQQIGAIECPETVREAVAAVPASTIHRLLEYNHHDGRFRRGLDNPLRIDALIVDEVSMVSLPMFARLLRAVPDGARVVILGDAQQLASVETGAVFADICELAAAPDSRWGANVARLDVSHRFRHGGGIDQLKTAVNRGDSDLALALLRSGVDGSLAWGHDDAPPPNTFDGLVSALSPYLEKWRRGYLTAPSPAAALELLNEFQILCSHRRGTLGVEALNRAARSCLRLKSRYAKGVPLMVARNSYEHRLFNGDVGLCWPDDEGGMKVFFPDQNNPGGLRSFPPSALPEHEDAFAITTHKSQGSGFGEVLLILGDARAGGLLTRELLYTGITRTRTQVVVWGAEQAIRSAVAKRTKRPSGLRHRLEPAAY